MLLGNLVLFSIWCLYSPFIWLPLGPADPPSTHYHYFLLPVNFQWPSNPKPEIFVPRLSMKNPEQFTVLTSVKSPVFFLSTKLASQEAFVHDLTYSV